MINWNNIVIGLSLLLMLFLFWKEISRKNRLRLAVRLGASLLAVTGLACLALPVSILKKINPGHRYEEAVLLTDGYNKDSLENFIKKNGGNLRLYKQDSIPWIDSGLTALHVFGYGLSGHELKLINNIPLIFHPPIVNSGITAVHWRQKLNSGEKLSVQGTFVNTRSWPVKIILDGFHTALDSVIIPAQKTATFEVSTFPKHIGKAVYSLALSDKHGVLEQAPVPIEVKAPDTLKVLLLAASPDFENKFLKRWLSENSYALASRTRTSKNKFDKTFINTTSFSFDKITNPLLDRFDIIISDAMELAALTKTEQSAIHTQVQENGMGLIVRADSIGSHAAFYAAPFLQYPSAGKQPSHAVLNIIDADKPTAPLAGEPFSYIRYKPGEQPLVLDSSSNIVVSSIMEGSGKILFTTLNNTYSWMLAGNSNDYYSFWSCLLQKAAKRTVSGQNLLIPGILPKMGEPVELYFETSNRPLPQA